jgi:hypothetical protein
VKKNKGWSIDLFTFSQNANKNDLINNQTWSKGGCGLPRQKFESVHVAFLSIESLAFSFNCASKGSKAPLPRTRSRHLGESPATFPNAHTACTFKHIREEFGHNYLAG